MKIQRSLTFLLFLMAVMIFIPTVSYSVEIVAKTGQTSCYDMTGAEITCDGTTGQDADTLAEQNGIDLPVARFTDNLDGTLTDTLTGLMWAQDANLMGGPVTWIAALEYSFNMTLGGNTDWRLPNMHELDSLIDYSSDTPLPTYLESQGFTDVQNGHYWSTNLYSAASSAWVMVMLDAPDDAFLGSSYLNDYPGQLRPYQNERPCGGTTFNSKDDLYADGPPCSPGFVGDKGPYAMFVRGDSDGTTPGTIGVRKATRTLNGARCVYYYDSAWRMDNRQTGPWSPACDGVTNNPADGSLDLAIDGIVNGDTYDNTFYGRQDAYLRKGANLPTGAGRFDYLGSGIDEVIYDTSTGLMWLRDSNCINTQYLVFDDYGAADGSVSWQMALDFVNGINDGTYPNCSAGYTDWRVPTINELFSISATADLFNPWSSRSFNNFCGWVSGCQIAPWSSTTYPYDKTKGIGVQFGGYRGCQVKVVGDKDYDGTGNTSWNSNKCGKPKMLIPVRTVTGYSLIENIISAGSGTVVPPEQSYDFDDLPITETLTANPNTGFTFSMWGGCDTGTGDDYDNCDATIPQSGNTTITAYFIPPTVDTSVAFGNVTTGLNADRTITVTNDGVTNLTLGAITNPALPFSLMSENCTTASPLVPGANCDIDLRFSPTSTGDFVGSFTMTNTVISLTGTGVNAPAGPDIGVSSNALDFMNTPVSTSPVKTLKVINDGTSDLTISAIAAPAAPFTIDYVTSSVPCGAVPIALGSGADCDIDVTYTAPGIPGGPDVSTISITSDDPDENPVTVSLAGSAIGAGNNAPTAPLLIFPPNGSANVSPIVFTWQDAVDPDADTLTHRRYYATDPSFVNAMVAGVDKSDSSISYAMVLGNPIFIIALFGIVALGVFLRRKKISLIIVAVVFTMGVLFISCAGHKDGESKGGAELQAGQTYYWKVVADDGNGGITESDTWSFTTQ